MKRSVTFGFNPTHCSSSGSSSFWTVIFLHTIWASFSASNLWPRALCSWPRTSASRCMASLTSLYYSCLELTSTTSPLCSHYSHTTQPKYTWAG